jgi:hypothetical protein
VGEQIDRAGQELVMASHPYGPGALPPTEWQTSSHVYTQSHAMACLRAGVIALVLLAVLALIILS